MERRAGDFQNGIRLVFCYFQMAGKSTFTERPLLRIVLLWGVSGGQHQSLATVQREFVKEFHLTKHPQHVSSLKASEAASLGST